MMMMMMFCSLRRVVDSDRERKTKWKFSERESTCDDVIATFRHRSRATFSDSVLSLSGSPSCLSNNIQLKLSHLLSPISLVSLTSQYQSLILLSFSGMMLYRCLLHVRGILHEESFLLSFYVCFFISVCLFLAFLFIAFALCSDVHMYFEVCHQSRDAIFRAQKYDTSR